MIPKPRIQTVAAKGKKEHPPKKELSPPSTPSSVFSSRPPSSGMDKMTVLAHDFDPTDLDVICARGKAAYKHAGNVRFRDIVEQHIPMYSTSSSKVEKGAIVSAIIAEIRHDSPDGGFVKEIDGTWYEVGDHNAREKVGQAFRDLLHTQYKSSTKAKAKIRQMNNQQLVKGQEETGKRKCLPKHHASVPDEKKTAKPAGNAKSPQAPKTPTSVQHPRKVISFTPPSPSVASLPPRRIEDASPTVYRRSRIAPMMVTMAEPGRLIMTPTTHQRTMQQLPEDVPSLPFFPHRRTASAPPHQHIQHALALHPPSSAPHSSILRGQKSPNIQNRTLTRASAALLVPPLTAPHTCTNASKASSSDPSRQAMVTERTEHTDQTTTTTISSEPSAQLPDDTPNDGMDYWSSTMQVISQRAQYHGPPPSQYPFRHHGPSHPFSHSNLLDSASSHLPPAPPLATHHLRPTDPRRSPGFNSLDDRPISPIDLHHPLDDHQHQANRPSSPQAMRANRGGDDAGSCSSLSHDLSGTHLMESLHRPADTLMEPLEPLSRQEFLARTVPTDVTMVDALGATDPDHQPSEGAGNPPVARALFHDVDEQDGDRVYSLEEEPKSNSPSP